MIELPKPLIAAVLDQHKVADAPHDFYRYPARFSPGFAREAIKAFTMPGDLVFDPFCGGGTTIVEALSLGRKAVGMDINSLAIFLTRAKTTPISRRDMRALIAWGDLLEYEIGVSRELQLRFFACDVDRYYVRNLPVGAKRFCFFVLNRLSLLASARQRTFARLILLGTGQWALDCKQLTPNSRNFVKEFCRRLRSSVSMYDSFLDHISTAGSIKRSALGKTRRIINRSSEFADQDARIPSGWLPAKLILTSPPYPGVHVVYHRWQILGRKETPAPFLFAGSRDGAGESHYLLGPRSEPGLVTYYSRLKRAFRALSSLVNDDSIVVQLVAFSDPSWQLPAYLQALEDVGFVEAEIVGDSLNLYKGRLWRHVPGRKWYASRKGDIGVTKEVLLIHTRAKSQFSRQWPRGFGQPG
jgi:hypothetical protein